MTERTYERNLNYGFQFAPTEVVRSITSRYLSEKFGHFASLPQNLLDLTLSKSFPIKDLQGIGDLGYGVYGAAGGASNSSFLARRIIGVVANSARTGSLLSATGTIGAVSNLSFVTSKLSNLGTNLNSLVDTALKDGLGVSTAIVDSELRQVKAVFKETANYYQSIGLDREADEFLGKINAIDAVASMSSNPSMKTAGQLEYVAAILNDSTNKIQSSVGVLSNVGNFIGGFSTIDSVLSTVASESWNILNTAESGNSLIKSAFAITNRLMQRDGTSGQYAWASAFVASTLVDAGIDAIDAASPAAWTKWGSPVNINNFSSLKPNDLLIFKTNTGIMHMAFLKSLNLLTREAMIMGGNQGAGAKMTKVTLNTARGNPFFYLAHVKRGWPTSKNAQLPSI